MTLNQIDKLQRVFGEARHVSRAYGVIGETVDNAVRKVDIQRDLLADLKPEDPGRLTQERIMAEMLQNASLARLNDALSSYDLHTGHHTPTAA